MLVGRLFAGAGSILLGWLIYGLANWGLSFTGLAEIHRIAMAAISGVVFVLALWGTDAIEALSEKP